jgi:hypothetical protein
MADVRRQEKQLNPNPSPRLVKSSAPTRSLLFLILLGLATAGWLYGLHWKRVASGDLFSSDETLMIRLQDQITALSIENQTLQQRLRELGGDEATEARLDPSGGTGPTSAPRPPVPPSPDSPSLPKPAQKIETH